MIYVRALRNLSDLRPWQIARTMHCELGQVYDALIISINPSRDEALCQTYLRAVKGKAQEISDAANKSSKKSKGPAS